jgi:hypothetical protein
MSLVQNFSATQTLGANSIINLEDTSEGSDGTLTSRRVYLIQADGEYLLPEGNEEDYIEWPIDEDTIEIDALTKDYSLNVLVHWLAGATVLYSKAVLCLFEQYNKEFLYQLTQKQTSNSVLVNDDSYYERKGQLLTELDSAENAVELAADQYAAQSCLDRATDLRLNYF